MRSRPVTRRSTRSAMRSPLDGQLGGGLPGRSDVVGFFRDDGAGGVVDNIGISSGPVQPGHALFLNGSTTITLEGAIAISGDFTLRWGGAFDTDGCLIAYNTTTGDYLRCNAVSNSLLLRLGGVNHSFNLVLNQDVFTTYTMSRIGTTLTLENSNGYNESLSCSADDFVFNQLGYTTTGHLYGVDFEGETGSCYCPGANNTGSSSLPYLANGVDATAVIAGHDSTIWALLYNGFGFDLNQLGFSNPSEGVFYPANPADSTVDITGGSLQYPGRLKYSLLTSGNTFAFPFCIDFYSIDQAAGGDFFYDSVNSMSPIYRDAEQWKLLPFVNNQTDGRVGVGTQNRVYVYDSVQNAADYSKAQRYIGNTPIVFPEGALVWYDFVEGEDPTVLYDISGNDRHGTLGAAGAAPEWMSQGLVFFKDDSTHVDVPSSALPSGDSAMTVIVSGHLPQIYDGQYNALFGYAGSVGLHNAPGVYLTALQPTTMQLRTGGGDNLSTVYPAGLDSHVYTYRYDPTSQELSGQVDGNTAETKTLSGAMAADATSGAKIGAYGNNGDPLSGFVYSLAVWDRVLTDAEVNMAVVAMSDPKTNDLIVFDGNSLTAGSPLSGVNTYPHQCMHSIRSGWDWWQFGVHGQTSTQMQSDFDTQILPLFNDVRGNQILVAWEIGNEMGLGPETAHTNFKNYCLHARSVLPSSVKIIVCNVTPRSTTGFNTDRATANALMAAQWSDYADALVDLAADTDIGQDASCTDLTYYQADGIHMTAAGYQKVAELVKAVILAV